MNDKKEPNIVKIIISSILESIFISSPIIPMFFIEYDTQMFMVAGTLCYVFAGIVIILLKKGKI